MPDRPTAWPAVEASPWGPIQLAATERGLVGLAVLSPPDAFLFDLERRSRVAVAGDRPTAPAASHLAAIRRQLERLFEGRPTTFTVPLDLRVASEWDRRVLEGVRAVGWGCTVGYGDVARRIGAPGAARAVGGAVGRNPLGIVIPCHRIIAGDGTIGGYGGDWYGSCEERLAVKRALLALEGIDLANRAPAEPAPRSDRRSFRP